MAHRHLSLLTRYAGLPLLLAGCGLGDDIPPSPRHDPATVITASKAGKRYFPEAFGKPTLVCEFGGVAKTQPIIGEIENTWFPQFWDAAEEPSLYERSRSPVAAGTSTLRFTWLPTFHHPVMVRIERSGHGAELIARQLSGMGGYDPGRIEQTVKRALSASEIAKLDAILSATDILAQPATECGLGTDGSQWIVEAADHNGYHFINRWTPQSGPVRKFGEFALQLTGWTFEKIY